MDQENKEFIFKSNTLYENVSVSNSIDQTLFNQYGSSNININDLDDIDRNKAITKENLQQFFASNTNLSVTNLLISQKRSFLAKLLLLNGHYIFFDCMSTRNIDPNFNYSGLNFQYNSEVQQSPNNAARIRMRLRPNPLSTNYFGIFFDAFPLRFDIVLINYEERKDLNGLWFVESGSEFVPSGNNQIQLSFRRYPRIATIQKSYHLDPFAFLGKFGQSSGGKLFMQDDPLYVNIADTQAITPMNFSEEKIDQIIAIEKMDIQSNNDILNFFAPNSFNSLRFFLKKATGSPSVTEISVRMDTFTFDIFAGMIKQIYNDPLSDVSLKLLFFSDLHDENNTTSSNDISCQVMYKENPNRMYLAYLRNDFPTQTTPFSYQLQFQRTSPVLDIQSTNNGTRIRSLTLQPGSHVIFERLEFNDQSIFDGRSFLSICGAS